MSDETVPKKKNKKRTGTFRMPDEVELNVKVGLEVRAYSKNGDCVGRLEINRAGLEPFVGARGTTSLGNLSWEDVFERLGRR
jgi:hypothetical protein